MKREVASAYQQSYIIVDSLLNDSSKIVIFHQYVKNIYGTDVKSIYIDTRAIVRLESYYNVGLYSFRRNSAHSMDKNYFLNYKDSLSFLSNNDDSIQWHDKIKSFMKTYENLLKLQDKESLNKILEENQKYDRASDR